MSQDEAEYWRLSADILAKTKKINFKDCKNIRITGLAGFPELDDSKQEEKIWNCLKKSTAGLVTVQGKNHDMCWVPSILPSSYNAPESTEVQGHRRRWCILKTMDGAGEVTLQKQSFWGLTPLGGPTEFPLQNHAFPDPLSKTSLYYAETLGHWGYFLWGAFQLGDFTCI